MHSIIIGAQKAGTTTLFDILAQSPDIDTADVKEINFFGFRFDKGVDWYHSQFHGQGKVRLDASPQYLHMPEVADQIEDTLPSARLVCLVRDPIARAVSNYRFNVSRGVQDPAQSLVEAIATDKGKEIYLYKGLYARQLDRFRSFAERGNLLLVDFANFTRRQQRAVDRVSDFIGIEAPSIAQETGEISNKTVAASGLGACVIYRAMEFKRAHPGLYEGLPNWVKRIIRGGKAAARQMPGGVQGTDPAALPTETREELQAYFRADLSKLQQNYEFTSDWMASYGLDVIEAGK